MSFFMHDDPAGHYHYGPLMRTMLYTGAAGGLGLDTTLLLSDRDRGRQRPCQGRAPAGSGRRQGGPFLSALNGFRATLDQLIADHGGFSKAALIDLTRAWARESGPDGIAVNAIAPGAFPTDAEKIHPDPESYNRMILDAQAVKRRAIAATIADRAPIAAETAKLNLRTAHRMSYDRAIDYERVLQVICFATADAAEGRAAFAQCRAPDFQRR